MQKTYELSSGIDVQWWKNFLIETNNLEDPVVIKNVISDKLEYYTNRCLYVIKLICLEKKIPARFRVWIDREQTTEYNQKIYDNLPEENQSLNEWAAKIFGDKKFGIIINDVEAFDANLNQKIAKLFKPLFDDIGLPSGGITMGMFIGNYGFTPLGIHYDSPEEQIFHLQLGPGTKYMYEWSKELYQELNGGIVGCQEITPLLSHAVKHEFQQGDLFYMPQKNYHVGDSPQLSLDLAIGLNNSPQNRIIKRIKEIRDEHFQFDNTVPLNPAYFSFEDRTEDLGINSLFSIDENYKNMTCKDYLAELASDYKNALLSNQGFYTKQFKTTSDCAFQDLEGRTIQCIAPFKILYKKLEGVAKIFCRGHILVVPYHAALSHVIDKINTYEAQQVNELIQPFLTEWSTEVGLYVISLLVNFQGAKVTDNN